MQLESQPKKTNYTWETANARILECNTAEELHQLEWELLTNDPLLPMYQMGVLMGMIDQKMYTVASEGFDVKGRFDKIRK